MHFYSYVSALSVGILCSTVTAIPLDFSSQTSILSAAKTIVSDVLNIYGNDSTGHIPGLFPAPYYFWESGLAWDSLINYWALSGDDSVVDTIQKALLFQVAPENDFMPPNQTRSEGNDDQSSWALAAMTAAEYGFPQTSSQTVSWLQLAQNVFDEQTQRWDSATCGGGLRWQIFTFNNGYNYKNTMSNGNFLQLAARLAKFTGNQTYSDWAQKTRDWSSATQLLTSDGSVYDGTDTATDCQSIDHVQWTSNAGTYLSGAAYALNATNPSNWSSLVTSLVSRSTSIFATLSDLVKRNGVITEVACAPQHNCNIDQLAFKAILARSFARTRDLTASSNVSQAGNDSTVNIVLRFSAVGAAAQCSGGQSGTLCGSDWTNTTWDGTTGLGQELSALEAILGLLPGKALRTSSSSTVSQGVSGTSTNGTTSPSTPGAAGVVGSTGGGSAVAPLCASAALAGIALAFFL